MRLFRRFTAWIGFLISPGHDLTRERALIPKPPITYPSITSVDKPPRNEDVEPGALYFVTNGKEPKWSLFKCPCGCRSVITLSLQRVHNPHWQLSLTHAARPTLYPSVWRDKGCMSHFWIRDGRVYWCKDTGFDPRFRHASD